MTETVQSLVLDLVEWVGRKDRTYRETMDAWRTSCPRLPVWEDANEHGFLETYARAGDVHVRPTAAGLAFLREKRPQAFAALSHSGET